MLFTTYIFWIFFACVLLIYWRIPHRSQNHLLLVASYIFYGAWDWRFLSLIAFSTIVDYIVALRIQSASSNHSRKRFLLVSIVTNLSLLGFFKYYGFFVHELNDLLSLMGLTASIPTLQVILPVGISFYTFQTLSYTIDVYRGETAPTKNFLDFALYVSFFPQLVAGPIERSSSLLPQILNPRKLGTDRFYEGVHLIVLGLFKKIVLADNMAPIANTIFSRDYNELTGLECLIGVYAFAFQIYGDFSGYSSIAKGIAKWMGFDLRSNFAMPYISQSPQEFWRRWHISLSTWLRDYLYIPLGGAQGSPIATYRNLTITMVLGGLWHGAAWTFVAWGIYHGLLLAVHRFIRENIRPAPAHRPLITKIFCIIGTFQLSCIGWLLFRAESMDQVWGMLSAITTNLNATALAVSGAATIAFFSLPLFVYETWQHAYSEHAEERMHGALTPHVIMYCYFALMILFFPPPVGHEFIYFQF